MSAELTLQLGANEVLIERSATDTQGVRVTWSSAEGDVTSIYAPFVAQGASILDAEVHNLSDLVFFLCGITPIKVRQRSRDYDSPLIRLSIRDIWCFCYLDQGHLDSSFFRLEDPFRGRKSQDAMRFFTGLHSETLSQLEADLARTQEDQSAKRESVKQIRLFMKRFNFENELDLVAELSGAESALREAKNRRDDIDAQRNVVVHPTDGLRSELRRQSEDVDGLRTAISEAEKIQLLSKAPRAEFATAKSQSLNDLIARLLCWVAFDIGLARSARVSFPSMWHRVSIATCASLTPPWNSRTRPCGRRHFRGISVSG